MQKMLSKIIRIDCLLAYALCLTLASGARFPHYCSECEQEVWEEVPCSDMPMTTTPKTTTQPPTMPTTTEATPTPMPPVTPTYLPPLTTTTPRPSGIICASGSATIAPQLQESKPFRKCYCDCKVGCKEFCRKVAYARPTQQITQMSATADNVPGSQMEITHLLQRKVYERKSEGNIHPYIIEQPPTVYSQPTALEASYSTSGVSAPSGKMANVYLKPADTYIAPMGYAPVIGSNTAPAAPPTSGESAPSGKMANVYLKPADTYIAPVGYAPVIGSNTAPAAPPIARVSASARTPPTRPNYNAVRRTTSGNYNIRKDTYPGYISTTPYPDTSFDNAIDTYLQDYVYGYRGREMVRPYSSSF